METKRRKEEVKLKARIVPSRPGETREEIKARMVELTARSELLKRYVQDLLNEKKFKTAF